MNLLAKEQLKAKEPGLTSDEVTRRTKQYLTLYYRLRKKEESRWSSRLSLRQRPGSGTGSNPHRPNGWHRASRQAVKIRPLMQPWVMMAPMAYSLQVGVKRQLNPSPGLMNRL